MQKTSPETDISQKEPTAEFFNNSGDEPKWAVGFATPALAGQGARPFISVCVWVRPDGTVITWFTHSP
jgi:hypothetical protein